MVAQKESVIMIMNQIDSIGDGFKRVLLSVYLRGDCMAEVNSLEDYVPSLTSVSNPYVLRIIFLFACGSHIYEASHETNDLQQGCKTYRLLEAAWESISCFYIIDLRGPWEFP